MRDVGAPDRRIATTGDAVGAAPARLELRLLGAFHASWDGDPLRHFQAGPRLRALVQHLVLAPGTPLSRAELASELWPEVPDAQARANLRQALARLARALPEARTFVHATAASVTWVAGAPTFVDVHAFREAVAAAEAQAGADPGAHRRALAAAAGLYRGDLVVDVVSERLERLRDDLHQAALRTLAALAERHAEAGDQRRAVAWLERLVELDPLDETAYRRMMTLHAEAGDRAKALRVFERWRDTLEREVGDVPRGPTVRIAERLRSRFDGGHGPASSGRAEERAHLAAALERARAAGPILVLVEGEPGIGKTSLLAAASLDQSMLGGAVLASEAGSLDAWVPYATAARLLGPTRLLAASRRLPAPWGPELRRLAGESTAVDRRLGAVRGAVAEGRAATDGARLRGVLHEVLADGGMDTVLFLDDAHHLDRESAAWLGDLIAAPRGARSPYAIVVAARGEEADASPLATLRRHAAEHGRLEVVELGPLGVDDVARLAATVRGRPLEPEDAELLARRSGGNPLFVLELLAAAANDPSGVDQAVPQRLEALIAARLQRLPPGAAETLEALAVLGADGRPEQLAQVLGRPASAIAGDLDGLWRARLLDFSQDAAPAVHPLVRDVAYARLAPARRASLHGRAADTLRLGQRRVGTPDAAIAHHLERAGRSLEAAEAYGRAAERAAAVAADDDAVATYRRAVTLLERTVAAPSDVASALWTGLGDVHARRLDGPSARAAYRQAAAHAAGDAVTAASLTQRIAATLTDERANGQALEQLAAADALLRSSRRRSGRWWRVAIDVEALRTRVMYLLPATDPVAEDAVLARLDAAVERHGTLAQRLERDYAQVRFAMRRERYRLSAVTVGHTERAARTAAATGHAVAMAEAAFALGFATLFGGRPEAAIAHLLEARRLAERCGARLFLVQSLAYLGLAYRLVDRAADAEVLHGDLAARVDAATPLYLGLAHAQRGWLAHRQGRTNDARAACDAALAAWSGHWYPFRWTALLVVAAMADDARDAVAAARAMVADDQQRLPEPLQTALRTLARGRVDGRGHGHGDGRGKGRADWCAVRDTVVGVAREVRHL